MNISFEKLSVLDIDKLVSWIKTPHVLEFWVSAQRKSDKEIYEKYKKRIENDTILTYIIHFNDFPIGMIQTYLIDNLSDFRISESAMGIDLFIGELDFTNRGIGTEVIRKFIREIILPKNVTYVCIDPEVRNTRAIHVYKKVGFVEMRHGIESHSKLPTCFMVLKIEDVF